MLTFEALVDSAYRAVLGRLPDAEGRQHALAALEAGMPVEVYLQNLLDSPEHRRRPSGGGLRFRHSKPVCTLIDSRLRLWIDLVDDYVSIPCLAENYEPSETEFILGRLGPGDRFIDIGANIGWFAVQAADRVGPNGRVYAFEPRRATFGLLEQSVRDNGFIARCHLYRLALGADENQGRLLGESGSTNLGGFRLARDDDERFENMVSEPVEIRTLDSLEIEGPVTLIKMDVEGAEPSVLTGARNLLKRDRPLILTEVHGPGLRHVSGMDASGFSALAHDLNYRLHRLDGARVGDEITDARGLGEPDPVNAILVPM